MSRTNHHRKYHRWNWTTREIYYNKPWTPWAGELSVEYRAIGMETWDLRFYAGCRRQPQPVHRTLNFHGRYPSRFHAAPGTARAAADKRENRLRGSVRRYAAEARGVYNAGGDVEALREPDLRPRSIERDIS